MQPQELIDAIDAALTGDWRHAHGIVQRDGHDPMACWIHAVLHKIEGDAWNSRYWYARTGQQYEDWNDAPAELRAIRERLADLAANSESTRR
jgi:hypothetical protein